VKTHVERGTRHFRGFGEAMKDTADCGGALLPQDGQGVQGGASGVDDERQRGGDRRTDMDAEALALPGHFPHAAPAEAVVVETGFADRDHPGLPGQRNQVGVARIAKIKEMIGQSGDFVKISNKYGDSQGQMTITAANRDQYPFYPELRGLSVNQNSDIVYAEQGYYIFRCFDRKGDDLYLSFVFVRGLDLNDYLSQETKDYWLWSLVD